jgi:uncharacterized repeat protein (TIGR03803 family)
MKRKIITGSTITLAIFASVLTISIAPTHAAAQTETVLKGFKGPNGTFPLAGVIFDSSGNLYGTVSGGGAYDFGAVFELIPNPGGGWTEKLLHSFNANGKDGYWPFASLVFDAAGNLYGTTSSGGTYRGGTVFELTPHAGGLWSEKVLHSFNTSGGDGVSPYGNLVFDAAGNLYGTTYYGGTASEGTVFELHPQGGGWLERVIHRFSGGDGQQPAGGLTFDGAGNLYGTASSGGGTLEDGTIFKLTPSAGGGWSLTVVFDFDGYDGAHPTGGLVFDTAGNLYGTTSGGDPEFGNVFELTPSASGTWTPTILLEFAGTAGEYPTGSLVFDPSGNLYGATTDGGANNEGSIFELSPSSGGSWTETVLYNFYSLSQGDDGYRPQAGVVLDAAGNLYGTTSAGGSAYDEGAVFEIKP